MDGTSSGDNGCLFVDEQSGLEFSKFEGPPDSVRSHLSTVAGDAAAAADFVNAVLEECDRRRDI